MTTPTALRQARLALQMSVAELGQAVGLSHSRAKAAQRVREMEAGQRDITGPVWRVVEALQSGWRPDE